MTDNTADTVLVLTDRPESHELALTSLGLDAKFFPNADMLIKALVDDHRCCGLVLDVRMVMATKSDTRDRLLALARNMPVMRAKTDPVTGHIEYLDHLGCFKSQACSTITPQFRLEDRIPVSLPVAIAKSGDPVMAEPHEATILDISPGGCFVAAEGPVLEESFVYLRLPHLQNRVPIHCAVRWSRMDRMGDKLPGLGVKFIDVKDEQLDEIMAKHLA